MKLAGFQKFIAGSLMGWKDHLGNRRFTKGYISMSRKNGKTLLISGLSLYELLIGKEPANERLIGLSANSREQASIAYDMTISQVESVRMKSPKVKQLTKITESKKKSQTYKTRVKLKQFRMKQVTWKVINLVMLLLMNFMKLKIEECTKL